MAPLPVFADKAPESAECELAPLVLAGQRGKAEQPVRRESVLLDGPLAPREASGLAHGFGRVEESATGAILEAVAEGHGHS